MKKSIIWYDLIMRDNIADEFFKNVKTEKNKIRLSKSVWVENLFSATYLFQQCVIDLTYVVQPFEPVHRFSVFFSYKSYDCFTAIVIFITLASYHTAHSIIDHIDCLSRGLDLNDSLL